MNASMLCGRIIQAHNNDVRTHLCSVYAVNLAANFSDGNRLLTLTDQDVKTVGWRESRHYSTRPKLEEVQRAHGKAVPARVHAAIPDTQNPFSSMWFLVVSVHRVSCASAAELHGVVTIIKGAVHESSATRRSKRH